MSVSSGNTESEFRFIDLFAGIGGFHFALNDLGAECVFASEINLFARQTYIHNHKKHSPRLFKEDNFAGDIKDVIPKNIPDFDILCGGFPCQPFSQAGYKRGFHDEKDNRGNLFFDIIKILKIKKPKAYFLENVRHIKNHDEGRTFKAIQNELERLDIPFTIRWSRRLITDCRSIAPAFSWSDLKVRKQRRAALSSRTLSP